jgi:hypothetical protein
MVVFSVSSEAETNKVKKEILVRIDKLFKEKVSTLNEAKHLFVEGCEWSGTINREKIFDVLFLPDILLPGKGKDFHPHECTNVQPKANPSARRSSSGYSSSPSLQRNMAKRSGRAGKLVKELIATPVEEEELKGSSSNASLGKRDFSKQPLELIPDRPEEALKEEEDVDGKDEGEEELDDISSSDHELDGKPKEKAVLSTAQEQQLDQKEVQKAAQELEPAQREVLEADPEPQPAQDQDQVPENREYDWQQVFEDLINRHKKVTFNFRDARYNPKAIDLTKVSSIHLE